MAQAIIFTGLPGSGKTNYFVDHFAATHAHVNRDILRTAEREATMIRECLRLAQPSQLSRVSHQIGADRGVKLCSVSKTFSRTLVVET